MKLLIIALLVLFASCELQQECADTNLKYNVENKARNFGNSPTVWPLVIKITDSNGMVRYIPMTQPEIDMFFKRADENKEDFD